jgi:hypothetical protein
MHGQAPDKQRIEKRNEWQLNANCECEEYFGDSFHSDPKRRKSAKHRYLPRIAVKVVGLFVAARI